MSDGIESGPGALPVLSDLRTKLNSAIVNGAEQSKEGDGFSGITG